MDLETAIEQAAHWQARADDHYERAAALNKDPRTVAQAATEMELAKYAYQRYQHFAARATSQPGPTPVAAAPVASATGPRPESRVRGVIALRTPATGR
ncbi:hypothetical protein ABT095_15125 [Kitasatospora sp. NPDC002227]|uniref:hypothetical protein n=1 Tax=Kitasatospora sp. NPDC002227 TaxID=3154773 RepID=UPI003334A184